MSKSWKIAIVTSLLIAVGVVIAMKAREEEPPANQTATTPATNPAPSTLEGNLPRLVDLGADKCIPCKMMAPILEELKTAYAHRLTVEFHDVWKNPGIGQKYGIRVIPTQIFYDASGKELFRHEGFMSKDDILTRWRELGVDVESEIEQRPQ